VPNLSAIYEPEDNRAGRELAWGLKRVFGADDLYFSSIGRVLFRCATNDRREQGD